MFQQFMRYLNYIYVYIYRVYNFLFTTHFLLKLFGGSRRAGFGTTNIQNGAALVFLVKNFLNDNRIPKNNTI